MLKTSTFITRLSLIITALIMNAVLVITSIAGYLSASNNAEETARASARVIFHAVKRDLWRAPSGPQEVAQWAIEEMGDQGLRFLGVFDLQGTELLASGKPVAPLTPRPPRTRMGPRVELQPLEQPWQTRVVFTPPRCTGRHRKHCRQHHWIGERRLFVVLDVEPPVARTIMSRALIYLITSLLAALILGVAAIVFWRLSRRSDRIAAQLAKDQQLKTLGQMSAVLGHELRNPIASLKGHAQLLMRKYAEDHPGRNSVETVDREVKRLEALTEQVLDFAKTGRFDLAPVDLPTLARSAIEKSGAEPVALQLDDTVGPWPLDQLKMEQALINLLHNARRASPRSEPIDLVIRTQDNTLSIEITDRGGGIAPGDEHRVFEPFFTRQTKGTGLGLSVTQRIIEGHGGTITAANHPRGGAVFRIVIAAGRTTD